MDEQQDQNKEQRIEENEKGRRKSKQHIFSPSSSPNHEFSFTISRPQSKSSLSISAVDLSPADDIFFHGHLLPLRLLSSLSRSPTRSLENDLFTLPIKEEEKGSIANTSTDNAQPRERVKAKSFSFFGLQTQRRKGSMEVKEERERKRRKLSFNMGNVIKRYMRVIRPLLFNRRKQDNMDLRRKPYSFSGYFSQKKIREARERGGGVSAPASMWASPRNSTTKSDSTMEELQDAIQAAIAHCKNSVAINEKTRSYV